MFKFHKQFLLASLLILPLSACGHLTQTAEVDLESTTTKVACGAFKIITYDRILDSDQTIVQVRQHNAAYRALCPALPVRDGSPQSPPSTLP